MICLSPCWEERFPILEPAVVVLSFLYSSINFALKSPSAITKNEFVQKCYLSLLYKTIAWNTWPATKRKSKHYIRAG